MNKVTIEVVEGIHLGDLGLSLENDFKGIVRVVPAGLRPAVDFYFDGKGLAEKVSKTRHSKLSVIAEAPSGTVEDFIRSFSIKHPEYRPVRLTKKEWVQWKKYGGKEDNLHPVEVIK